MKDGELLYWVSLSRRKGLCRLLARDELLAEGPSS